MARAVILNSGRRKRRRRRSHHADDYVNEAFRLRCPPDEWLRSKSIGQSYSSIHSVSVVSRWIKMSIRHVFFFCYNLSPFVTGRPKKRKKNGVWFFHADWMGRGHSVSGKRMGRLGTGWAGLDVQRKKSRTYLLFIIQPPKKAFWQHSS